MKRLLHFFSLAVVTQVILMLSQLVLLPIQLRLWGSSSTAAWYSALALAAMAYFADGGLRTAGHADLVQAHANADFAARHRFRQIWSWIRVLLFIGTVVLIGFNLIIGKLTQATGHEVFSRAMLTLACALESILIVRISYLDSLGKYRGAEASYFAFAVLRLSLSVPTLVIFHWGAPELAAVYLLTSAAAVGFQGWFLCRPVPLLQLTSGFPQLKWSSLGLARYTLAEPIANWARLSLPVLVIARISSPQAVTAYVALRALFGAGRTTVQQLARVASVEFLRMREDNHARRSESLLKLFLVAAVFLGSMTGATVIADNLRMVGLWLKKTDRHLFQEIALAFSLTAPFFSYQIAMSLKMRIGQLAYVARRHYVFIACSLVFSGMSFLISALPVYLTLLVVAELTLSGSFLAADSAGRSALKAGVMGSLAVCALGLAARDNAGDLFSRLAPRPMLVSGGVLAFIIILAAGLFWWNYRTDVAVVAK